jgi:hypothetical protein
VNIVERYQDVYPTKIQTGAELFQLVHLASLAFPRVALYFESSITPTDLPILTAAASTVERVEQVGGKLVVDSRRGSGVSWTVPALVDGHLWPVASSSTVWLPSGKHSVEASATSPPLLLEDFNGEIKSASASAKSIDFSYQSSARAYAVVNPKPTKMAIDGALVVLELNGNVLTLPRGQHLVTLVP